MMTITPGYGTDCIAADAVRDYNKPIHFHLRKADGALAAYRGDDHDCPDRRKQRTLDDLQRPRSM